MAPRKTKKTDAPAAEDSSSSVPALDAGIEKKTRKPNSWNVYYKAEYAKYKTSDAHKDKTHSQLTSLIKDEYKLKKEQQKTAAAAEQSASTEQ